MALRVLLADESTTIKKVMQLALQDFAVEVKAVHSGVDVLEVARTFKPDIVFADVLLQKKNGYEVCHDLKSDSQLSSIPVVLMWSSFMDLDEKLANGSGANRRLEKPFDIENLRTIVLELVPRTRDQKLAHFLRFPDSFAEPMKSEEKSKQEAKPKTAPGTPPPQAKPSNTPPPPPAREATPAAAQSDTKPSWNMDSFDDINEFSGTNPKASPPKEDDEEEAFSEVRLSPKTVSTPSVKLPPPESEIEMTDAADETWSHKDLSRFKIDLPPVAVETEEESALAFELPPQDPDEPSIVVRKPPQTKPKEGDFALEEDMNGETTLEIEAVEPAGSRADLDLEIEETATPTTKTAVKKGRPHDRPVETPVPGASRHQLDELSAITDFSNDLRSGAAAAPMGVDRLEEIVRAQSREIIEELVRRLVPDLAAEIIREELERLLEDTSVREARKISSAGPEGLR